MYIWEGRMDMSTMIKGQVYDVTKIRLVGWTTDNADGYDLFAYFDGQGRYLGPDCDGVEPIVEITM